MDMHRKLIQAIRDGNLNMVKYLVEKGVNIHANDDDAITTADIYRHQPEVAKFLREKGAGRGVQYMLNRKLIDAIKEDNFELVKDVVRKGANVNVCWGDPIRRACTYNCFDIIKFLIENGADIHSEDEQPLRRASIYGQFELVKFLVENGADINNKNHGTALAWASEKGHFNIVKYLIEKGADIHIVNDDALMGACSGGNLKILKFLIGKGADLHARNNEALIWADREGSFEVVKFLIDKGFNKKLLKNKKCLKYLKWLNKIKDRKAVIIQKYWLKWKNR